MNYAKVILESDLMLLDVDSQFRQFLSKYVEIINTIFLRLSSRSDRFSFYFKFTGLTIPYGRFGCKLRKNELKSYTVKLILKLISILSTT
jgi:hypothetical protein